MRIILIPSSKVLLGLPRIVIGDMTFPRLRRRLVLMLLGASCLERLCTSEYDIECLYGVILEL